jgi:NAD(P)-dependent dehydrogenase (short-subunit alcohol dehydrogenase family)
LDRGVDRFDDDPRRSSSREPLFRHPAESFALAGHREESVRAAAKALTATGHKALAIGCNVADERQVAAMVEQTVSAFGRLEAAFNNAGVQSPIAETADASGEEFDRVNGISRRGVWS